MATASLDGIRIEVSHTNPPDQVAGQLAAFAQDLASGRFREWGVRVEQGDAGHLDLVGERGGTHFRAKVVSEDSRVVMTLDGQVQISRITLTLAGGADGLRRRVRDEISQALRRHLET